MWDLNKYKPTEKNSKFSDFFPCIEIKYKIKLDFCNDS